MEQLPLPRRLSSLSRHTNPMSPIPPSPPEHKLWLDSLPIDLCTRVASFIISYSYRSVVNFANVSDVQRLAMKNAFAGKLDLAYFESATATSYEYSWDSGQPSTALETDYVSLIGDDVHEIQITGSQFFPHSVQRCFKSPSLNKLVIHNRPCHSHYLLFISNLRVLQMSSIRFDVMSFLKRISIPILDLQQLKIQSAATTCLHKQFSDDPRRHSMLASWFPRVDTLHLECGKCNPVTKPSSYLWHAIERFPELKHVTITESLPDYAVDTLRQMESVTLQDGDVFKLAEKIKECVVGIVTTHAWYENPNKTNMQGNQFERLAGCSRLQHLACCTTRGTEYSLANIVGNLRSLHIGYADDDTTENNISASDYLNMITPRSEALLNAFRQAPFLKSVSFASIPIPASKLCEMLTVLGDRLEKFRGGIFSAYWNDTHIVYDAEENKQEFEDIIQVLRTASLYNPQLRELGLRCNLLRLQDGDLIDANIAQQSIFPLLPTFQACVVVLQRRAPRLDVEGWKRLLRQFRASCSQKVSFSEESE